MYGRGYVSYGLITADALTNKGRYRAARAAKNNNNKTTATNYIFNKDDICKELCTALLEDWKRICHNCLSCLTD